MRAMDASARVVVYGAYGHTGRFVVEELLRRGITPVVAGRSPEKIEAYEPPAPGIEKWAAAVEDRPTLQRSLEGAAAVINCAGPFLDTALPLASAAVAVGAHYLDVTAEQAAVQLIYRELGDTARAAGVGVVPAMAFYGGLADLLVTAALDGTDRADDVTIAIALDHWWPTVGTRRTGRRNTAPRVIISGGKLSEVGASTPTSTWAFPEPFGDQPVVLLPFSEVIAIADHLHVEELRSYLNTAPLNDLRDPQTPPPTAVDANGRSSQRFAVDVAVRQGEQTRRLCASGVDIYAVTAPIIVEGAVRLLSGQTRRLGAGAPGAIFDAADVISALSSQALDVSPKS
jgi:NAD(P)-dependent dehydrogenase (short-subunit alcohol dehydrogenase family)